PGEDGFGDNGSGQQAAQLKTENGENGKEGISQYVNIEDPPLSGTFCASRSHVVGRKFFENTGAKHANQDCGQSQTKRKRRQNHMHPAAVSGYGKPSQGDGKEQDQ